MRFALWVDSTWRREGEAVSTALMRLHAAAGVSHSTLYYAHKGCRTTANTALRIEKFTKGAVKAEELVFGPTRGERPSRKATHG